MNKNEKLKIATRFSKPAYILAATSIIVQALFKIMHWPFANEVQLFKTISILILIFTLYYENKNLKEIIKN
jgi:hypothetical protein